MNKESDEKVERGYRKGIYPIPEQFIH